MLYSTTAMTSPVRSGSGSGSGNGSGPQRVSCASAPGKVILFGEHAVVFGQPAIAAALSDLRIHVKVVATETQHVVVSMPDLQPVPLRQVTLEASKLVNTSFKGPPTKEDAAVIQQMLHESLPFPVDEIAMSALTPLVYLLNKLTPKIFASGMDICVRSHDLPVGAGLGSSAAFSVALAAALFGLSYCQNGGVQRAASKAAQPSSRQLEVINQYAFYSEILLHGTPSGIDNAVSAYGRAIMYTRGDGNVSMQHLEMPRLNMILTHTHVPRSTKTLVAAVRAMYDKHTAIVQGMLDSMGAIATTFREMITEQDFETRGEDMLTLVRTNQHLLRAMGVSHPSLDHICSVADEQVGLGEVATKLTGAGGGGCAMTLLKPDADPALAPKIQAALQDSSKRGQKPWNYSCLTSTVGGDGVLWTDPSSFDESLPEASDSTSDCEVKSYRIPVAVAAVAAIALFATSRIASR